MAVSSSGKSARRLSRAARRQALVRARQHFNAGRFWEAHEDLETVWRSVSEEGERQAWQGLIQAAAALVHRQRANRHGVAVVGRAALGKLAEGQHPRVEFETVAFRARLAAALA